MANPPSTSRLSTHFTRYASRWIFLVFVLLSVVAAVQSWSLPHSAPVLSVEGLDSIPAYTHYENYVIFRNSYRHLLADANLYADYPAEHWDLYKYSPVFALFMGLFNAMPDLFGLVTWNLVNALLLFFGIRALKGLSDGQKNTILLIATFDLMGSMQNEQSNGMVAGLIVFGFALLENRRYLMATFCLVASVFVKLFGLVAFVLCLFYPEKWKIALYSLAWTLLFAFLPLVAVDFSSLNYQYEQWGILLANDHSASLGYSVMGWLRAWFGDILDKQTVLWLGVLLLLMPFLKTRRYTEPQFRYLSLASVLIWIILFNHKAESPTYVIAMTGLGLWFALSSREKIDWILLIFALFFTTFSSTDLFPRSIRSSIIEPYLFKVLPVMLIWGRIWWVQWVEKKKGKNEERLRH